MHYPTAGKNSNTEEFPGALEFKSKKLFQNFWRIKTRDYLIKNGKLMRR